MVLEGYHRCPDSHDLSECHHLYDFGRHLLPTISLTVLTLTPKNYPWKPSGTTLTSMYAQCTLKEALHILQHTTWIWIYPEHVSSDSYIIQSYIIYMLNSSVIHYTDYDSGYLMSVRYLCLNQDAVTLIKFWSIDFCSDICLDQLFIGFTVVCLRLEWIKEALVFLLELGGVILFRTSISPLVDVWVSVYVMDQVDALLDSRIPGYPRVRLPGS